jgi:predicted metal-binding protein
LSNSKKSDKYVKLARKLGVDAKAIPISNIFFDDRALLKCEGCESYARHWLCPPNVMKPAEFKRIVKNYHSAVLTHSNDAGKFRDVMYQLESKAFVDGKYWAFALFPDFCCEKCSYPSSCKNPGMDRPMLHSHGIDEYKTARKAGFKVYPLRNKDERQNRFGLLLID